MRHQHHIHIVFFKLERYHIVTYVKILILNTPIMLLWKMHMEDHKSSLLFLWMFVYVEGIRAILIFFVVRKNFYISSWCHSGSFFSSLPVYSMPDNWICLWRKIEIYLLMHIMEWNFWGYAGKGWIIENFRCEQTWHFRKMEANFDIWQKKFCLPQTFSIPEIEKFIFLMSTTWQNCTLKNLFPSSTKIDWVSL